MGTAESAYKEWIELYNPNDEEVDLKDWKIKAQDGAPEIVLKNKISPRSFYLLTKNTSKKMFPDERADQVYSGASLSNDGEYLELLNEAGETMDFVDGKNGWKQKGENEKKLTAERDDDEKGWHTSSVIGGTPKEKNSLPEKKTEETKKEFVCRENEKPVFLNEILPNPVGVDKNQEWVEVHNPNSEEVDLSGWKLINSSKKSFVLQEGIVVENFLKISLPTSFVIKNQKEKISLFDCWGKLQDEVSFEDSAGSGISYNKDENGSWQWSRWTTPGEKNRLNHLPKIKIKKIKEAYAGMKVIFDGSDSSDEDGEKLKFVWDFGDGRKSYLNKTSHLFEKTGEYAISLQVKDGSAVAEKKFVLEIKKYPQRKIIITRILPNPKGRDTEGELIRLKNQERKSINLKGWKILSGSEKKRATGHPIFNDFFLKAGEEKALSRKESLFILPNQKGYLALVYPNGKKADQLGYFFEEKSIPEEVGYFLDDEGAWQWEASKEKLKELKIETSDSEEEAATSEEEIKVLGLTAGFGWRQIFENAEKRKTLSWKELTFVNWQKENSIWLELFPKIF